MTAQFKQLDRAYFEQLIDHLIDHFPWTPVEGQAGIEKAAVRAGQESPSVGELQLTHLHTDAYIYVSFPDYREGNAARLVLYHPLDENIPSEEENFIGALGRSHQTIAEIYKSDYIVPEADPNIILQGCVPVNYSTKKVHSMMTAISAVVLRVQRLHKKIHSPISNVLSQTPSSPNGASNNFDPCVSTGG